MTDVQKWKDLLDAIARLAVAEIVRDGDVDEARIGEVPRLYHLLDPPAYGLTLREAMYHRVSALADDLRLSIKAEGPGSFAADAREAK